MQLVAGPNGVGRSTFHGSCLRVADPDWVDPLDATFAAQPPGQRWNPPGVECLHLSSDRLTARANVDRKLVGLPYGPEDLDPATAPVLIEVTIPDGIAAGAGESVVIEHRVGDQHRGNGRPAGHRALGGPRRDQWCSPGSPQPPRLPRSSAAPSGSQAAPRVVGAGDLSRAADCHR